MELELNQELALVLDLELDLMLELLKLKLYFVLLPKLNELMLERQSQMELELDWKLE